jgi:hypothetical protein
MPTDRARIMPTDRARIMPTDRAPALSGLPRRAGSRAQCTCDVGYGGTECSFACPTFYDQPCGCSDPTLSTCRGTCSSSDGTCACKNSYRGVNCGILCLGGPTNTCSRHGTCAGDGSCMCNPGWTGSMCEIECPGGWQKPCSGHGICSAQGQNSSRCACDTGLEGLVGSYQGVSCEKAILNENIRVENSENETLHGMRDARPNALCPLSKTLLPILALLEKRDQNHTLACSTFLTRFSSAVEPFSGQSWPASVIPLLAALVIASPWIQRLVKIYKDQKLQKLGTQVRGPSPYSEPRVECRGLRNGWGLRANASHGSRVPDPESVVASPLMLQAGAFDRVAHGGILFSECSRVGMLHPLVV